MSGRQATRGGGQRSLSRERARVGSVIAAEGPQELPWQGNYVYDDASSQPRHGGIAFERKRLSPRQSRKGVPWIRTIPPVSRLEAYAAFFATACSCACGRPGTQPWPGLPGVRTS